MSIYDEIMDKHHFMMECYKDFRDLCEELRDERGEDHDGFAEYLSPKEEELNVTADMWSMPLSTLLSPPRSLDEFPEQKTLTDNPWAINPEDPELYTGKALGIPVAVVVRQSNGDDKLYPIVNGKFEGYGL